MFDSLITTLHFFTLCAIICGLFFVIYKFIIADLRRKATALFLLTILVTSIVVIFFYLENRRKSINIINNTLQINIDESIITTKDIRIDCCHADVIDFEAKIPTTNNEKIISSIIESDHYTNKPSTSITKCIPTKGKSEIQQKSWHPYEKGYRFTYRDGTGKCVIAEYDTVTTYFKYKQNVWSAPE